MDSMNTKPTDASTAVECVHYWELEHGIDESACHHGFPPVPYVQERCIECGETREVDQDFSPDDDGESDFDFLPVRDGPSLRVDP